MKVIYLVNRVSESPVPTTVEIDGEPMRVTVDELEVELVDPEGRQGTITRRYRKTKDKEEARATYVQGETIEIDL